MKRMMTILMVMSGLLATQSVEAGSTPGICYVYLTAPCRGAGPNVYFAPGRYFADTVAIAHMNAARCLERAQEYKNWCGPWTDRDGKVIKSVEVNVIYQVKGINVIGAATNGKGKSVVHDGIARFTKFSK